MVKGRQGERVRLYVRGTVLGYKRSKSNQYPSTSLIQIEGVNTQEEVAWSLDLMVTVALFVLNSSPTCLPNPWEQESESSCIPATYEFLLPRGHLNPSFAKAAFNIVLRNSIADIVEFWALRLFAVKTLLFTICIHRQWNAIATVAAAAVGGRGGRV
ncbi:hypothetical protein NL676_019835 [Syzygium grande]|nr:hypothetical protein NL676_019835 [Syzygium grande]